MNPYIEKLNAYLAEHSPDYCYRDAHNLLEMFYHFYTEINPINNSAIRSHYQKLDGYLQRFTQQEQDALFTIIYHIYADQEREAFMEGIRVGTRLTLELLK